MEVQNENNGNFSNLFLLLSKQIEKISGTGNIIKYCSKAEQYCYSDQVSFYVYLRKAVECFLRYLFYSHEGDPEWKLPEKYIYDENGKRHPKEILSNADYLNAAKIRKDIKNKIFEILDKANNSVHNDEDSGVYTPQVLYTFEEILVEYFKVIDGHITPVSNKGIEELKKAIDDNDISKVKKVISKGVIIDAAKSEIAKLALSCICDNKIEIFDCLKENGFDENNAHIKFKKGLLTYQIENNLWDNFSEEQKINSLIMAIEEGQSKELEFILNQEGERYYKFDDGNTILHYAANGHLRNIIEICEKYVDVNSQNNFGNTPLMQAAMNSKCDATKVLLELGADIGIKNNNNQTAFEKAVIFGNEEIIKFYISKYKEQLDFNYCDSTGKSLLMMSVPSDNLSIFKLLIECGADINYSYKGINVQVMAALNNSHDILKYLFFQGMKLPKRISSNDFDFSIYNDMGYIDVERYNIKQTTDISFFTFLWNMYTQEEKCIDSKTIDILLEHGYKPDLYVIPGFSIFELLLYNKEYDLLLEIINKFKTNICQINEIPVIASCVRLCEDDAIWLSEKLISLGIEPNVVDKNTGNSALHYACISGNLKLIQKLIILGCDVYKKNNEGITPFMIYIISNNTEKIISLYELFYEHISIENRDSYFNETDNYGWSVFHYCIQNEETVHFLLSKGLDCNKQSTKSKSLKINVSKTKYLPNGLSPLMLALAGGENKTVRTLIEFDADVSLKDVLGRNALFYACMNNNNAGVKAILDLNLLSLHDRAMFTTEIIKNDKEIKFNGEEGTILDYAIKKENLPLIKMLLSIDKTLGKYKDTKESLKKLKKSLSL